MPFSPPSAGSGRTARLLGVFLAFCFFNISALVASIVQSDPFAGLSAIQVEETAVDARGYLKRCELVEAPCGRGIMGIPLQLNRFVHRDAEGNETWHGIQVERADRILVGLAPRTPATWLAKVLVAHPGKFRALADPTLGPDSYQVEIAQPGLGVASGLAAYLETFPEVEYAECEVAVLDLEEMDSFSEATDINPFSYVLEQVGDPQFWADTSFAELNELFATWELTEGSRDVIVAVVDTGIDLKHGDLKDQLWINSGEIEGDWKDNDGNGFVDDCHGGWNFAGFESPYPSYSNNPKHIANKSYHGTAIAGVIGAAANDVHTLGIAPKCQLMILKCSTELINHPWPFPGDVARSIRYAVDNGASIINLSLSTMPSSALAKAVLHAENNGVLLVAAAGNSSKSISPGVNIYYPALYNSLSNVISVGSVRWDGKKEPMSNYSSKYVDLGVYSWKGYRLAVPNKCVYVDDGGTSTASAVVSGTAALLKAIHPHWNAAKIKSHLLATAQKRNTLKNYFSEGSLLDIHEAVKTKYPGKLRFSSSNQINYLEQENPFCKMVFERVGGTEDKASFRWKVDHVTTEPEDFEFGKKLNEPNHGNLVVWNPGEGGEKSISFKIVDDGIDEIDESFRIKIYEVSGFTNRDENHIVPVLFKILDDDYAKNQVGFTTPYYEVPEDAGWVHFPVQRLFGNSTLFVSCQVTSLTAVENKDYIVKSKDLVWGSSNKGNRMVPILPINDMAMEKDEFFLMTLTDKYHPHTIDPLRSWMVVKIIDEDKNNKVAKP